MKFSGGVEWAVHCCVVLTEINEPVPATKLAEFHDVSATYLAKQMQALARSGIVRSIQGKSGGYVLTRAPEEITVLDVVVATEGPGPMFQCTEIRQRGPLAAPPENCHEACPVAKAMIAGETAWRNALSDITIGDIAGQVGTGPDGTLGTVRKWFVGA